MPPVQPQPFGPDDLVFTPGRAGLTDLVTAELTGVGDTSDTFERDYAASLTGLSSLPSQLADADTSLFEAHSAHEALRGYDPGVPALLRQAQAATGATQSQFEGAMVVPSSPGQTPQPVFTPPVSTSPPAPPGGVPTQPPTGVPAPGSSFVGPGNAGFPTVTGGPTAGRPVHGA